MELWRFEDDRIFATKIEILFGKLAGPDCAAGARIDPKHRRTAEDERAVGTGAIRKRTMRVPHIIQIVLGSDSLPFCKHLYESVLGSAGAEERLIYNQHKGQVMGPGPWSGATVLYMAGRQELMQIEFWTHTTPPQRPPSSDWRQSAIAHRR